MANNDWKMVGLSKGKINKTGLELMLNSSQVAGLVETAANRSTEGNKRYLKVERMSGKVGIKGRAADRVGVKISFKPNVDLHPRHMANILLQVKGKKIRQLVRKPRRRVTTSKKVAGK